MKRFVKYSAKRYPDSNGVIFQTSIQIGEIQIVCTGDEQSDDITLSVWIGSPATEYRATVRSNETPKLRKVKK